MPTDLSSTAPESAAASVLRSVLVRSELIPPAQTEGLVEAMVRVLQDAGLQITQVPKRFESTAHMDILDRFRGRE